MNSTITNWRQRQNKGERHGNIIQYAKADGINYIEYVAERDMTILLGSSIQYSTFLILQYLTLIISTIFTNLHYCDDLTIFWRGSL